jgi:hypothetical protein
VLVAVVVTDFSLHKFTGQLILVSNEQSLGSEIRYGFDGCAVLNVNLPCEARQKERKIYGFELLRSEFSMYR